MSGRGGHREGHGPGWGCRRTNVRGGRSSLRAGDAGWLLLRCHTGSRQHPVLLGQEATFKPTLQRGELGLRGPQGGSGTGRRSHEGCMPACWAQTRADWAGACFSPNNPPQRKSREKSPDRVGGACGMRSPQVCATPQPRPAAPPFLRRAATCPACSSWNPTRPLALSVGPS